MNEYTQREELIRLLTGIHAMLGTIMGTLIGLLLVAVVAFGFAVGTGAFFS